MNDDLFRRVRQRANDDGIPMRAIIEAALRAYLSGQGRHAPGYRFEWKTFRGRLRPGVDLDDRDSLFEIMEGRR